MKTTGAVLAVAVLVAPAGRISAQQKVEGAAGFRCVKSADDGEQSKGNGTTAVDYTKMARSLVRYPHNPVVKVGEKGTWNDQTLGCFTVLDDGDRFFLYSEGAQFGKDKNIGMATSKDGIHWTYYDKNPLFAGGMPYAIKVGNTFRLYYAGVGGLQMRTSKDGFLWGQPTRVMKSCADPKVIQVAENKFHLYYCDGAERTRNGKKGWEFRNYVVTSTDGIKWEGEPQQVLPLGPPGSWDSDAHAGPVVRKLADGFHLWYLGTGSAFTDKMVWRIGHATSPDGLNWTKSGTEPVLDVGQPGDWDGGTFLSFDILFRNREGKLLFWYAAAATGHEDETKMKIQIGHGTSR